MAVEVSVRKIIHVDMDAFYASVEQRDNPDLKGRPIAVTDPRGWGIVAAASYEARSLGVRAGVPVAKAKHDCPELLVVYARFALYQEISSSIHAIFGSYTSLIEPVFLDEAYLDVTGNHDFPSATDIARDIRIRIAEEIGLPSSAGVSYNKFLAKLASDLAKPDGLLVIRPSDGQNFVEHLPIERFHGVGPSTAAKMKEFAIRTGGDLRALSLECLVDRFGKHGHYFYGISRGIDDRPVQLKAPPRSHGSDTSFKTHLHTLNEMKLAIQPLIDNVWRKQEDHGFNGRTVTIRLRYSDFTQVTRSRSTSQKLASRDELESISFELLEAQMPLPMAVRLLGVSISNPTSFPASCATGDDEEEPQQLKFAL